MAKDAQFLKNVAKEYSHSIKVKEPEYVLRFKTWDSPYRNDVEEGGQLCLTPTIAKELISIRDWLVAFPCSVPIHIVAMDDIAIYSDVWEYVDVNKDYCHTSECFNWSIIEDIASGKYSGSTVIFCYGKNEFKYYPDTKSTYVYSYEFCDQEECYQRFDYYRKGEKEPFKSVLSKYDGNQDVYVDVDTNQHYDADGRNITKR